MFNKFFLSLSSFSHSFKDFASLFIVNHKPMTGEGLDKVLNRTFLEILITGVKTVAIVVTYLHRPRPRTNFFGIDPTENRSIQCGNKLRSRVRGGLVRYYPACIAYYLSNE